MTRLQRRCTRRQQRLEAVLQYIEAHNGDAVDVSALASMASISPFHFHRVFSSHVGEPVLAHIRRLRLEKAAWRILFLDQTVTEVAALAGYSSSAAFTRAFRGQFGTTPRKFVRDVVNVRSSNGTGMGALPAGPDYRRLPVFNVVGVKRMGPYQRAPWEAWDALRRHLQHAGQGDGAWMRIGIPLDWPELTRVDRRRYEACVVADLAPDGEMFRKQVGGGTFAVFTHRGPYQELQAAQEAIYWHWNPNGGVRLRDAPAFHIYKDVDDRNTDPARLVTEICVPVDVAQAVRPGVQGPQEPARLEC